MKMRKGDCECGCLLVIVVLALAICGVGSCIDNERLERRELKKMECDAIRESAKISSVRERLLEEEIRQLKALIPTNVTLNIKLDDIINKK